ncbi:MAG: adenylyltransferase/cytidyltransferase family protein [Candidatus Ranarchaeia archaeon]
MAISLGKIKRILIAGTFEIIHPGHIALIQEAAELGDVVVVVARDSTVERIRKRPAIIPEDQRLDVIRNIKGVDYAVLGNEGPERFRIIASIRPDVILLGPNQDVDINDLKNWIQSHKLDIEVRRMQSLYNRYLLCSTSAIIDRIIGLSKTFGFLTVKKGSQDLT